MAHIDGNSPETSLAFRVVRLVVPWVLLGVVAAVLWSFVTDYRAATGSGPAEGSAEATQQVPVSPAGPYVIVLSDGLNLRAEASTAAPVVQVLAADLQLTLIEEGVGWYHVRTAEGVEGWVAAGGTYTQLVNP